MYDEPAPTGDVKPGSSSKSNMMSMSGDSFGSAVGRSLKLGGRSALALRLLLAGVSQRLSTSAGVATGEEVRSYEGIVLLVLRLIHVDSLKLHYCQHLLKYTE
jgi:hypothetical protein